MPFVYINCATIRDWNSFHDVFSREMGFPSFYGRNLNAWIDCMTSLDTPEDGLTSVHCGPGDIVTLLLDRADLLPREIYEALVDDVAFVNWRRTVVGERPVLALAAWRTHAVAFDPAVAAELVGRSRPVAIAVGANTGDAAANIRAAYEELTKSTFLTNVRLSPLFRTAPVRVSLDGPDPGGDYTNAAITAESPASPHAILKLLQSVELRGGRDRTNSPHGAPRPIDLDLLLVGDAALVTPDLTLPHPRMHQRAFVLVPLAEIAPDLLVPGTNKTVAELLAALGPIDAAAVNRLC